jgi:predicted DNA-binding transcriptional regulator
MSYSSIIKIVFSTINLTKTDIEILKLLISSKGGLLISDIIQKIKRSERNIRKRIVLLIEKGFLIRKIEILNNKRLAYRYYIESEKNIIDRITNQLYLKIENLNELKNI